MPSGCEIAGGQAERTENEKRLLYASFIRRRITCRVEEEIDFDAKAERVHRQTSASKKIASRKASQNAIEGSGRCCRIPRGSAGSVGLTGLTKQSTKMLVITSTTVHEFGMTAIAKQFPDWWFPRISTFLMFGNVRRGLAGS